MCVGHEPPDDTMLPMTRPRCEECKVKELLNDAAASNVCIVVFTIQTAFSSHVVTPQISLMMLLSEDMYAINVGSCPF
jgi:hypothetical protein